MPVRFLIYIFATVNMENMKKGIIFSIEEFAITRWTGESGQPFFLKGCPLRCTWCHNPEGIAPQPQRMVKKNECSICGYEIMSGELAERILRNKEIYWLNHGGVTFTGGGTSFSS